MNSEADNAALRIVGGRRLSGEIEIAGAKNAAMPCLAAALLADEASVIERVPNIIDVRRFCDLLRELGASAEHDPQAGSVEVSVGSVDRLVEVAPDDLMQTQRASFLLVGALLGRGLSRVESARPGGDKIGERLLDIHLNGFRKLGATVHEDANGRIIAEAKRRLRGAPLFLDYPSVSGTENLMLAAVLAEGRTEIVHAAPEPEVVCLAELLRDMGACISGAGTGTIVIDGVERLHGGRQRLIPDRIEAGTLAIAAAISVAEPPLIAAAISVAEPPLIAADRRGDQRRLGDAARRGPGSDGRRVRETERDGHFDRAARRLTHGARAPIARDAESRQCADDALPRLPNRPASADDRAAHAGAGRIRH